MANPILSSDDIVSFSFQRATLRTPPRLDALRTQGALARTLLDELERVAPRRAELIGAQLVEELTRLGCRILETAAALSNEHERRREQTEEPSSGTFEVRRGDEGDS